MAINVNMDLQDVTKIVNLRDSINTEIETIGVHRDKLRNLRSDLEDLISDCDEAEEYLKDASLALDEAADALSRQV